MTTELTLSEHLEGLRSALVAFVRYVDRAGLRAPVPTSPDWTVRQPRRPPGDGAPVGRRDRPRRRLDPDAVEREGQVSPDPVEWLRDGAIELAQALTDAPEDLKVLRFLDDPPPARQFWARRQCHETTIHAVDALSAALGRYPVAADTWITATRSPSTASTSCSPASSPGRCPGCGAPSRSRSPYDPEDAERSWLVEVGARPGGHDPHRAAPVQPTSPRGVGGRALPDPVEPQRRGRRRTRLRPVARRRPGALGLTGSPGRVAHGAG